MFAGRAPWCWLTRLSNSSHACIARSTCIYATLSLPRSLRPVFHDSYTTIARLTAISQDLPTLSICQTRCFSRSVSVISVKRRDSSLPTVCDRSVRRQTLFISKWKAHVRLWARLSSRDFLSYCCITTDATTRSDWQEAHVARDDEMISVLHVIQFCPALYFTGQ